MARPRNTEANALVREKLLIEGERTFRAQSFAETGINDILRAASVPKGSFYHYFPTKEAFGIAVAERYHQSQLAMARGFIGDLSHAPIDRLALFFRTARELMRERGYAGGCLMCNLTTELADEKPAFQAELDRHWSALAAELQPALTVDTLADLNLSHLSAEEAAEWLLSAWSGALTRMKASGDGRPLDLFLRTVFKEKGSLS